MVQCGAKKCLPGSEHEYTKVGYYTTLSLPYILKTTIRVIRKGLNYYMPGMSVSLQIVHDIFMSFFGISKLLQLFQQRVNL